MTGKVNNPAARARRGFTLLEVMVAVVILGLGILGLSALFAGAAAQQARSTETNLSVGFARNAEAMLSRELGKISGPSAAVIGGQEGRWLHVPMADETTNACSKYSLTIDSYGTGGLYFLVESAPQVIYLAPAGAIAAAAAPIFGSSAALNQIFAGSINALPDRRVHPAELSVTVNISRRVPVAGGGFTEVEARSVTFVPGPTLTDPNRDPPYNNIILRPEDPGLGAPYSQAFGAMDFDVPFNTSSPNPPLAAFIASHVGMNGFRQFVIIDPADLPGPCNERARVWFFVELAGGAEPEFITSVIFNTYQFRNDRLVSLNDRLVYEPDDRFPGGRRPVMGFTTLVRYFSTSAQLVVFTYGLQPLGVPKDNTEKLAFLPPERLIDTQNGAPNGLLRLLTNSDKLELRYDDVNEQYIVLAEEDNQVQADAVQPGQVLMIQSIAETGKGADAPVRVISQRQDPRYPGKIVGVLDRGPRSEGRSALGDLNSFALVSVFAFNPLVESLTSDETEWRIRPIDARVFQIGVTR